MVGGKTQKRYTISKCLEADDRRDGRGERATGLLPNGDDRLKCWSVWHEASVSIIETCTVQMEPTKSVQWCAESRYGRRETMGTQLGLGAA